MCGRETAASIRNNNNNNTNISSKSTMIGRQPVPKSIPATTPESLTQLSLETPPSPVSPPNYVSKYGFVPTQALERFISPVTKLVLGTGPK